MKTKSIITSLFVIIAIVAIGFGVANCGGCQCDSGNQCSCTGKCSCQNCKCDNCVKEAPKNLNLSIYIDLSDRIIKEQNGYKQVDKDLEIINSITQSLSDKVWNKNIKYAKDCIKVFFYPSPNDSQINKLSQELVVNFGDFNKKQVQDKMDKATNLSKNFNNILTTIYTSALNDNKFYGSDIWGFFDTKANDMCVKDGYRNILVILTDGYIYDDHINKKDANGGQNFITPQSLAAETPLTPLNEGKKIDNLEVLVLEVNANPEGDFHKIETTIGNWFKTMGISKYKIVQTDLPANTKTIIENFLNEK